MFSKLSVTILIYLDSFFVEVINKTQSSANYRASFCLHVNI